MSERLTVALEDGTKELLVQLAGGERKVGAYLSALIRQMSARELVPATELDALEQKFNETDRRIDSIESRLMEARPLAEALLWMADQMPNAIRRYEAMSDEQKASLKHASELLPEPPSLTALQGKFPELWEPLPPESADETHVTHGDLP